MSPGAGPFQRVACVVGCGGICAGPAIGWPICQLAYSGSLEHDACVCPLAMPRRRLVPNSVDRPHVAWGAGHRLAMSVGAAGIGRRQWSRRIGRRIWRQRRSSGICPLCRLSGTRSWQMFRLQHLPSVVLAREVQGRQQGPAHSECPGTSVARRSHFLARRFNGQQPLAFSWHRFRRTSARYYHRNKNVAGDIVWGVVRSFAPNTQAALLDCACEFVACVVSAASLGLAPACCPQPLRPRSRHCVVRPFASQPGQSRAPGKPWF